MSKMWYMSIDYWLFNIYVLVYKFLSVILYMIISILINEKYINW
jgi:hypothetical protein